MPSNPPNRRQRNEVGANPLQWEACAASSEHDFEDAADVRIGGPIRSIEVAVLSLLLSTLSWLLGPLGSVSGVILGHLAKSRRTQTSSRSGDRAAIAGLVIGYSFSAAAILTVQILLVGAVTSIVVFKNPLQAALGYWFLGYSILALVAWFYMVVKQPRLGRNLTLGLLVTGALFSLFILGLRSSRDDARENLTINRLRNLGVFWQEFEQDQGRRD